MIAIKILLLKTIIQSLIHVKIIKISSCNIVHIMVVGIKCCLQEETNRL